MLQLVLKAKLPYLRLRVRRHRESAQASRRLVLQELGLVLLQVARVLQEL
jgi:hypothetical protein